MLAERPSATLADLVDQLGGHPNTTRAQLDRLVATGFAAEVDRPRHGRGRPARGYCATVAGRQVALEGPDRGQTALLEAVADHLAANSDPGAAAHEVGLAWGRRLAAGVGLVELLAGQGFTPEVQGDDIALRTCPLLDAARGNPDVVCGIHQGLIDAVSDRPMRLAPFARPGACVVYPR